MNGLRFFDVTANANGLGRWGQGWCCRGAKDTIECAARNTSGDPTLNSTRCSTDAARWWTGLCNSRNVLRNRCGCHHFWLLLNRLGPLLHDWGTLPAGLCRNNRAELRMKANSEVT